MSDPHIIYIRATNDRNGNPRRGWLIQEPERIWWHDEGYAGWSVPGIRGEYLAHYAKDAVTINVTATEYRRLRKQWEE